VTLNRDVRFRPPLGGRCRPEAGAPSRCAVPGGPAFPAGTRFVPVRGPGRL